mmetsp:Transcript_55398/g.127331  ORF Transcript_55398/g.127331 Transcript_55398/m.127331 type:complete len:264 (-) Transcript_55398:575-1366(-)
MDKREVSSSSCVSMALLARASADLVTLSKSREEGSSSCRGCKPSTIWRSPSSSSSGSICSSESRRRQTSISPVDTSISASRSICCFCSSESGWLAVSAPLSSASAAVIKSSCQAECICLSSGTTASASCLMKEAAAERPSISVASSAPPSPPSPSSPSSTSVPSAEEPRPLSLGVAGVNEAIRSCSARRRRAKYSLRSASSAPSRRNSRKTVPPSSAAGTSAPPCSLAVRSCERRRMMRDDSEEIPSKERTCATAESIRRALR